jgi:hypothetical protein
MNRKVKKIPIEIIHQTLFRRPLDVYRVLKMRNPPLEVRRVKRQFLKAIKRFNERPYVCACSVEGCAEPVLMPRVGVDTHVISPLCRRHFISNTDGSFWLPTYSMPSYRAVISSAASVRGSTAATFEKFVRRVAELKGLPPGRITEKKIREFFAEAPQSQPMD